MTLRGFRLGFVLGFVLVAAAWYFTWRPAAFNPSHPWWSRLFLLMEFGGFVWSLVFLLTVRRLSERQVRPAPSGLPVDVVITTYSEPVDVVRRTVLAALEIAYPHETWLLDDGNRPEMRHMAQSVGCRYLSRSANIDAKAGNLNHALPCLKGDFIALFDADHIAHPRFLDRTLGFFEDDRLAFVQTPQEFVNTDSYQHFRTADPGRAPVHEQSLFFHIIQRGRDVYNAAMLCGTCAVIRRAALDEVGGFATGSVTEDMKTSVRLHAAGWRSLFTPEILSAGIAPFDGRDFRRQRLRWAQGAMQVLVQENMLWNGKLSIAQRLHYFLHVVTQIDGWWRTAMFFLPALVLLTSFAPINASPLVYAVHFVPYFTASVASYELFGRGYGHFVESELYNLARCSISMQATFAALRRSLPFRVTSKTRSSGSDWIGLALPWSLVAVTTVALVEALTSVLRGTSHFPAGSLFIVAMWATFVLYVASRGLVRAANATNDRRAQPRFALDLHAQIGLHRVPIVAIATDGITLQPHSPIAEGCTTLTIVLGKRHFTLDASLARRGRGLFGGRLTWHDERERAAFDLAIHYAQIQHLDPLHAALSTERDLCESLVTSQPA